MKKIMHILILISTITLLTSCVGIMYRKLPQPFTYWQSEDNLLFFSIQGIQQHDGMGTMLILDEEVDVFVELYPHIIRLMIYEIKDDAVDFENPMMIFKIETGSLDGLTMTLLSEENNTQDTFYDDTTLHMSRRDLNKEDDIIDARYYYGTHFYSDTSSWYFECLFDNGKLYQWIGKIVMDDKVRSVILILKENQQYEIVENGEIILRGTYETDGLSLTLLMEEHVHISSPKVTLEGTYQRKMD